jgi:stearoyl-CoA desaturase (Delta-9 desaturase)
MVEIGFLNTAWWVPLAFLVVAGHLTNVSTTIYLHRAMTHGGVALHPLVSIPMRFWLWLTTGVVTREWVACHRKHHAYADREGDPHSPVLEGLHQILFNGWGHYRRAISDPAMLEKYGKGCPDDRLERMVFSRLSYTGVVILLLINVVLFGLVWGPLVWFAQIIWMPILGGAVNGIGHAWGYRNYESKDHSRNFFPAGLLLGGEELHNNHHADPRSARFRRRWFELDIGWIYIKILSWLKLARVVYAAP